MLTSAGQYGHSNFMLTCLTQIISKTRFDALANGVEFYWKRQEVGISHDELFKVDKMSSALKWTSDFYLEMAFGDRTIKSEAKRATF